MTATAILQYINVSKSFNGVDVLKNISFQLNKGSILGLVGENGAGKSTMMNILGGVFSYDHGKIMLDGTSYTPESPIDAIKHKIAFIHQELNLFSNLSIAENIFITSFPCSSYLGMPKINKSEMMNKTNEILKKVDLPYSPNTLVENLSQGERQLVEISKAISQDAKIIIFDEPTTSLSARETEKLFTIIEKLKNSGISMIYISHILQDIYQLCDDIVILRDGEVVGKGAIQAITVDQLIPLMVGRTMNRMYPDHDRSIGPLVLEVKGLSQEGIVNDINFEVRASEVVGIFGLMGSGRSELARILFGLDRFEKGEILYKRATLKNSTPRANISRGMAFLTENRREEGLLLEQSIEDNAALVALPKFSIGWLKWIDRIRIKERTIQVTSAFRIFAVNTDKQAVKTLSGGNQQKVVIGKWVMNEPSIFILDEPTRGIDIGAKFDVYTIINQLAEKGTGVILISSELEELMGMCDRILVMNYGEITAQMNKEQFDREQILRHALGGA
jgi:ribose transport system ATP-binding protein